MISQSIHRILNGHPPLLYDSGDQSRCFTYVDNAVAGPSLASESSLAIGEALNIGSMTETTMRDAVELAIKIADVESVTDAENVDTATLYGGRYEDIPRRIPDRPRRSGNWDGGSGRRRGRDSPHHRLGAGQPVVSERTYRGHLRWRANGRKSLASIESPIAGRSDGREIRASERNSIRDATR